ncbi:MAG: protein-L-isoaspartate(D-aspartate) O-methyltransferase [Gammaproteobacteria bacterium]|nr:MAG: protein-L-isoaspartate(D-aspartate) O-methyltransferase [Gammaproteobacteria bacterium]
MIEKRNLQGIGMTSQRTRDRLVQRLKDRGVSNKAVLDVIRQIPRHLFVEEALASRAYEDSPLPIGFGQTISQPYIVAMMTEIILEEQKPSKVLEIGTGSGYQAAVLSQLVDSVYTVERIEPLHKRSRSLFNKLRLSNIYTKLYDGSWGWSGKGPFNAIVVTAAPEEVPQELLLQLAENGRLIVPVGSQKAEQELVLYTRSGEQFYEEHLGSVNFVPLLANRC